MSFTAPRGLKLLNIEDFSSFSVNFVKSTISMSFLILFKSTVKTENNDIYFIEIGSYMMNISRL